MTENANFKLIEKDKIVAAVEGGPQYLFDSIDEKYVVQFAWLPILEEAGAILAEALLTKLTDSFADALLGNSDSSAKFQQEVIERLTRIEKKVDWVISYLQDVFPLLFKHIDKKINEQYQVKLPVTLGSLKDAIALAGGKGKIDSDIAARIESAVSGVAEATETLLRIENGQAFFGCGIQGLTALLSAYSRIARYNISTLRALGSMSARWAKIAYPWTDEGVEWSLAALLKKQKIELEKAQHILDSVPARVLTSITTYGVYPTSTSFLYSGSIHVGENFGITGTFHFGREAKQVSPGLVSPINFEEVASKNGLDYRGWWKPRECGPSDGNPHQAGAIYDQMLDLVSRAGDVLRAKSAVDELQMQVNQLRSFVQACEKLSALETGILN